MSVHRVVIALSLIIVLDCPWALGQHSSIGAKERQKEGHTLTDLAAREAPRVQRNAVYERYSWITAKPAPPRMFKVGDLLTIIVRESRRFKADAELDTKKEFDIKSELEAFFKLTNGGIGATAFRRGKPSVDYRFDNELKGEGDARREDSLTTRLTGAIIDVKPNGLLVLEARASVRHDDEISTITFTGTCRKQDVTADNTILSTQVADKSVVVTNEGAVRDASRRGWIPRLIDLVRPF